MIYVWEFFVGPSNKINRLILENLEETITTERKRKDFKLPLILPPKEPLLTYWFDSYYYFFLCKCILWDIYKTNTTLLDLFGDLQNFVRIKKSTQINLDENFIVGREIVDLVLWGRSQGNFFRVFFVSSLHWP